VSRSERRDGAGVDPVLSMILERFDYARVGDHVAVVQILARVQAGHQAPDAAELIVSTTRDVPLRFPARACRSERRLLAGGAVQTLWRALFTLPLSAVERPGALCELSAGRGSAETVVLPVPGARYPGVAALQLVPGDILARTSSAQLRQAVAVATAVAVTATSTPVMAVAAAATGTAGHAAGSHARIANHVHFAQDRLRQQNSPTDPTATAAAARQTSKRKSATKAAAAARAVATGKSPTPAKHAPHTEGLAPLTSGTPKSIKRPASSSSSSTTPSATQPTAPPSANPATVAPTGSSGGVATGNTIDPGQVSTTTQTSSGQTPPAQTPTAPSTPAQTPTPPTATAPTPTVPTPAAPTPSSTSPRPSAPPSTQPGTTTPPRATRAHSEPISHRRTPSARHHSSGGAAPVLGSLTNRPPTRLASSRTTSTGVPTLSANPPGFSGPQSWTGTVSENPALIGAVGNLSNLLANGDSPPGFLIPIYMEAGRRYGVPWEVLAAINAVESDYGRNLNTSSAGAIGWMQFEPSTWHEWGLAADGHSVANPYDPRDAIFSAARYLAAAGAAKDIWGAIYAYNHASWYVDMVMTRARAIAANIRPERQTVHRGVVSVYFSTYERRHPTLRFRGGVLSHYVRLVAAANMVSAANFPYVWGGGHEQPARFAPFDCSGSVSYVVQQAGYRVPTSVSGDISSWGFPSGPGRVTIFYNPTHTFMRIGNRYFGTSGFARPGGGAGWFSTNHLPASYLAQFSEVHVPVLGANSFSRHRKLRLRSGQRHGSGLSKLSSTGPLVLSQLSPYPAFSPARKFHL
jgi:hypothetical protein